MGHGRPERQIHCEAKGETMIESRANNCLTSTFISAGRTDSSYIYTELEDETTEA